jgi:hypothetical protein
MTPEVSSAIDEIRELFPAASVKTEEDGQGGAYVEVEPVDLGDKYKPTSSWCGFHITFQYPRADVYPHFLSAGITRVDNSAFGEGVSGQQWRGKSALQLSRRSKRLDPSIDTAATKLAKVITWFKSL